MKKLVTAAFAGLMLAGSALSALAGEAEGVVASIDEATRTIALEDGSVYVAADDVDLTAIAAGDKVKVTFDDGTTNATAVAKEAM